MAAPLITFHEISGTAIGTTKEYGTVDSGTNSQTFEIRIWNGKDYGGTVVASNVRVTTKTMSGLDSGDTVANGNEIVTGKWLYVRELTDNGVAAVAPYSDETAVGGTTVKQLNDLETNTYISISARLVVPDNATAGIASAKLRILYQYT